MRLSSLISIKSLNKAIVLFLSFFCFSLGHSEIIRESGSLIEFFQGNEEGCEYDNWVSHISEGISRLGYNYYGPSELDRQTTGFGSCVLIDSMENSDTILNEWHEMATFLLRDNAQLASQILGSSDFSDFYQLVRLDDNGKIYWILRETLNNEYFDDNGTEIESDDVRGSFDYGWGIYIFNFEATAENVVIELPHPCDDFLSSPIGMDAFLTIDARLIMVSGAGREVIWSGGITNDNSLSDPSRNARSAFHAVHRAAVDNIDDELIIQIHSYDSDGHPSSWPSELSTWYDDHPNQPVFDFENHNDIVSLIPPVPVLANSIGNQVHDQVAIDQYLSVWHVRDSLGVYLHRGETAIFNNVYLPGGMVNHQRTYCHEDHDEYQDLENWLHIEHDEFPNVINEELLDFYPPGNVPTHETYAEAVKYFHPIYVAVRDYYNPRSLRIVPDDYPSIQTTIMESDNGDTVLVQPGVYYENLDFSGKEITVASNYILEENQNQIFRTILDGRDTTSLVRYINAESNSARLIGFVLRHGHNEYGGAIYCGNNTSPFIKDCYILNSRGFQGGGIYCDQDSDPILEHCVIRNNRTTSSGGGVFLNNAQMTLRKTQLVDNFSEFAGAALKIENSDAILINCTVSENQGSGQDYASIWAESSGEGSCGLVVVNSILWNENAVEVLSRGRGDINQINISHSDVDGGEDQIVLEDENNYHWEEGNINQNPRFFDVERNNYYLWDESPCINSGTDFYTFDRDTLINYTREKYVGRAPDIGALEFDPENAVDYEIPFNPNSHKLISVFPNPFNSHFTIEFQTTDLYRIELFDNLGRKVRDLNMENTYLIGDKCAFSCNDLAAGLYYLQLKSSHITQIRTIILAR